MKMKEMEIEKQEASALPSHLQQIVLEECRKRAKIKPSEVFIYVGFVLGFTVVAALGPLRFAMEFQAYDTVSQPAGLLIRLMWVPFLFFPVLLAYLFFVRPRKLLKKAESEQYTCYLGQLTDTDMVKTRDSKGHTHRRYYLILDGGFRCGCTSAEYDEAVIGAQYMAVFFGKKSPEFCLPILE